MVKLMSQNCNIVYVFFLVLVKFLIQLFTFYYVLNAFLYYFVHVTSSKSFVLRLANQNKNGN